MKKKQLSSNRQSKSPKHKVNQNETSDELIHNFIELLTEKVDEMHDVMHNQNTSSASIPLSSASPASKTTPLPVDQPTTLSSLYKGLLSEEIDLNDMRVKIDTQTTNAGDGDQRLEASVQNSSASNSGQSSAGILHRTAYNYASIETTNYSYGFTNYEFFAFIGSLDPVEYILVITIIAILIGVELNVYERQIIGSVLVDIGITLGNMVEQELFRTARRNEILNRERNEAEQNDFDTLYNDIDRLQNEINTLKQQLGINEI